MHLTTIKSFFATKRERFVEARSASPAGAFGGNASKANVYLRDAGDVGSGFRGSARSGEVVKEFSRKMKDLGQELCDTLLLYKEDPVRLLLVEDDNDDAELAQYEISKSGCNCTVQRVHTGEQGIAAVKEISLNNLDTSAVEKRKQFDAALIDLVLPGCSGLEAAKVMVEYASLVICICSGHVVPYGAMEEAVEKGFVIFPKPLRKEHVKMILHAVKALKERGQNI